jgi:integrase
MQERHRRTNEARGHTRCCRFVVQSPAVDTSRISSQPWIWQLELTNLLKALPGSWTTSCSTGQTVRSLAEGWTTAEVRRRKNEAERQELERQAGITFATFADQGFFGYEGRWVLDRRASGKRLSPRQCEDKQQTFNKHVIPMLGQMKLHQINRAVLKDFRNGMYKAGYSGSTINRALDWIRAVLEAAEDENRIEAVPRIDRAASKPAQRGILSVDEFHRIFMVRWIDPRAYLANALAAVTGCRMGEVLALRASNIDPGRLLVAVERSYDSAERVMSQTTKNGKVRPITVPPMVCRGLETLAEANPQGEDDPLVFWSDETPDKPCDYKLITRGLYRAMAQIGIDEVERRRRSLSFHSWRHWLNSRLIETHVPPEKIRMLTGHSSSDMTLLYYHAQVDAMGDVREVQARMLEGCFITPITP